MTQPHEHSRPGTGDAAIHLEPDDQWFDLEGEGFELEERNALRRVAGIRTDLEDVTEVEYRQLRLERVVLMGVYPRGEDARLTVRAQGPGRDGRLRGPRGPDPAQGQTRPQVRRVRQGA